MVNNQREPSFHPHFIVEGLWSVSIAFLGEDSGLGNQIGGGCILGEYYTYMPGDFHKNTHFFSVWYGEHREVATLISSQPWKQTVPFRLVSRNKQLSNLSNVG